MGKQGNAGQRRKDVHRAWLAKPILCPSFFEGMRIGSHLCRSVQTEDMNFHLRFMYNICMLLTF